jgi:hypothetical protein
VAVVMVGLVAAGTAYLLLRTPTVRIHGTFTQIEPLACSAGSPGDLARASIVVFDQQGRALASTRVSGPVRVRTERVLGFPHCREWAAYEVTVPRSASYAMGLPGRDARFASVSYRRLADARFEYDLTY